MPKIEHTYTCEECGKPATYNVEDIRVTYKVLPDDDFEKTDEYYLDDSERFFCDDHYIR